MSDEELLLQGANFVKSFRGYKNIKKSFKVPTRKTSDISSPVAVRNIKEVPPFRSLLCVEQEA